MGEKKILTDDLIEEKLKTVVRTEIKYIDPMKLAQWTLDTACEMVDNAISRKSLDRAITTGELESYRVGAKVTVEPAKFLLWYRRHRK